MHDSMFRAKVFRKGFEEICRAASANIFNGNLKNLLQDRGADAARKAKYEGIAPQLGLNLSYLQEVERNLPLKDAIQTIVANMSSRAFSFEGKRRRMYIDGDYDSGDGVRVDAIENNEREDGDEGIDCELDSLEAITREELEEFRCIT